MSDVQTWVNVKQHADLTLDALDERLKDAGFECNARGSFKHYGVHQCGDGSAWFIQPFRSDLPANFDGNATRFSALYGSKDVKLRLDGSGRKAAYPDDNPKTIYGVKKPPVHAIPPSAILHLGMAMRSGKNKYGLMNWRDKNVTFSTYYDAAFRHLLEAWDGASVDDESKLDPLCHVMACCAIILDARLQGTLIDDRGTAGELHKLIAHYKQLLEAEFAAAQNGAAE